MLNFFLFLAIVVISLLDGSSFLSFFGNCTHLFFKDFLSTCLTFGYCLCFLNTDNPSFFSSPFESTIINFIIIRKNIPVKEKKNCIYMVSLLMDIIKKKKSIDYMVTIKITIKKNK